MSLCIPSLCKGNHKLQIFSIILCGHHPIMIHIDSCFWVHHKILVMSSFDGLRHPFHPSHHTSSLGCISYSNLCRMNVKNISKNGMGNG